MEFWVQAGGAAVMTKAEEYRLKAKECEERADRTRDVFVKQHLLELAKHWRTLAEYKRSIRAKSARLATADGSWDFPTRGRANSVARPL
jgi:hypothetical protein